MATKKKNLAPVGVFKLKESTKHPTPHLEMCANINETVAGYKLHVELRITELSLGDAAELRDSLTKWLKSWGRK